MICGAVGTFSMFYITVNYIPSLLIERHVALANVFLFTLVITAAQIPWKIVNGIAAEYIGRKKVYVIFMGLAVLSAWQFGLAATPLAMVLWGMMLHSASGSAPSYKMWYAEQYPTHIRAIGQSTVEAIGGRFVGGVLWTFLFPVLLASFGLTVTMDIAAAIALFGLAGPTAFAPETFRRTVETIESELARSETATPASVAPERGHPAG
jgi:MFS transporter, putative metabolite:H+ symporter